jgi:hypothetical protein
MDVRITLDGDPTCPHCVNGIVQVEEERRCCDGHACACYGQPIVDVIGQDFCACPEGQYRAAVEAGVICDEAERGALVFVEGW